MTTMTAQASTIAMATVSVLAQTHVSVQRAGVDKAASLRHAGVYSDAKMLIVKHFLSKLTSVSLEKTTK